MANKLKFIGSAIKRVWKKTITLTVPESIVFGAVISIVTRTVDRIVNFVCSKTHVAAAA